MSNTSQHAGEQKALALDQKRMLAKQEVDSANDARVAGGGAQAGFPGGKALSAGKALPDPLNW